MRPLCALLVAWPIAAAADASPPSRKAPAPSLLRVRGADAHQAARLVAEVFRVNVVAIGGLGAPLDLDAAPADAEAALRAIAAKAGLVVARRPPVYWLTPRERPLVAAARPGLRQAGLPISIDFYRAPAATVMEVLATVAKQEARGAPAGEMTVFVRRVPAGDLLDDLRAYAAAGPLPAAAARTDDGCARRADSQLLACVPLGELALYGVAARPDGPRVALLGRKGGAALVLARVGDTVGREGARVTAIVDGGVSFSDGRAVTLAGR